MSLSSISTKVVSSESLIISDVKTSSLGIDNSVKMSLESIMILSSLYFRQLNYKRGFFYFKSCQIVWGNKNGLFLKTPLDLTEPLIVGWFFFS